MPPLIQDINADVRMSGLEGFLQRFLGPRCPEFGCEEAEVERVKMPRPLDRFFRFAGRWPGHNPAAPYANRFCMQDSLCAIRKNSYASALEVMDGRLVFVHENQGVWVASTEQFGEDPPVWISEDCSHRESVRKWRQLERPLSHFLVSFTLQEVMFGSRIVSTATGTLKIFAESQIPIEPVWMNGEYAWGIDRPSYFLVGNSILVRQAINEGDGVEWYGCSRREGEEILIAVGLPIDF